MTQHRVSCRITGTEGWRGPVVLPENLKRTCAMVAKGLTVREATTWLKVGKTALYEAQRSAL